MRNKKSRKDVLDYIEQGIRYAVVVPAICEQQAMSVANNYGDTREIKAWKERVQQNPKARLYLLVPPIEGLKGFEDFENGLPQEWREVVKPINVSSDKPNSGRCDRLVVHSALNVYERNPQKNVVVVTDDRKDIFTGPIMTNLGRYHLRRKGQGRDDKGKNQCCQSLHVC